MGIPDAFCSPAYITDSFNEMEEKGRATAPLAAKIPTLQDVLSIAGVDAAGQEKFVFCTRNDGPLWSWLREQA